MCDKDPHCRVLTPGEIALAQGVFGDQIDYQKVKVFSRPWFMVPSNPFFAPSLMSPNGNIYTVMEGQYSDDYSSESKWNKIMFIHEMTHVWQYQSGKNVPVAAIRAYFDNDQDYLKAYKYDINGDQGFEELNIEQQAEMVEDYFYARKSNDYADMKKLEGKLAPYFPLKPVVKPTI